MPIDRTEAVLRDQLAQFDAKGTRKGVETVFTGVVPATGEHGPRFHLEGEGDRQFLRMNSNSYLGLSLRPDVIAAEEAASRAYGVGPGAVRFISGSYGPHLELERRLAEFHGREAGMIFSSAYATTVAVMSPLISPETAVISDELNHNCIINAMRMARPKEKHIYKHLDFDDLEAKLEQAAGSCTRALVVTDGIFSMRGDHADLARLHEVVERFDARFPENVIVMVDDSHGVGAFGLTGRGTEEYSGAPKSDVLIATLGKALGVNGGYVVGSQTLIDYLRETAALYIYSNPITVGEAAAALRSLEVLAGAEGRALLDHLRAMTSAFEQGLLDLGFETIPGDHPVVPLMVRDTARTTALVEHLRDHGILATGLNFPVVPRGDEEIRFQISADHTPADIAFTLDILAQFSDRG